MNDLADFMEKTKPEGKTSKLMPYFEDIVALKTHGYSEGQILQYLLEKKGLNVSRPTLSRFVRAHVKHDEKVLRSDIVKKETKVLNGKPGESEPQKDTGESEPQKDTGNQNSGNAFNWQQKINADEYI